MGTKIIKLTIFLALAFIIDSTITYLLPYKIRGSYEFVSSIGILSFLYVVNALKLRYQYWYALAVGFYYSIIYANSQFIYVWLFMLDVFLIHVYIKTRKISFNESIVNSIGLIVIHQTIPFIVYSLTNMTNLSITQFLFLRLLPTLAGNMVFGLVIYFVVDQLKIFEVEQTFY